MKRQKANATFVDRLAVAFLSGLIALITATIIWLILLGFNYIGTSLLIVSYRWVLGFSLLMAALGFLLKENFLASLFGYLWHGILLMLGINPNDRL